MITTQARNELLGLELNARVLRELDNEHLDELFQSIASRAEFADLLAEGIEAELDMKAWSAAASDDGKARQKASRARRRRLTHADNKRAGLRSRCSYRACEARGATRLAGQGRGEQTLTVLNVADVPSLEALVSAEGDVDLEALQAELEKKARTSDDVVLPVAFRKRARALFVVRESDIHALVLFDGQRSQTYLSHRHIPEVRAVLEAGLSPMKGDFDVAEPILNADGTPKKNRDGSIKTRTVRVPVERRRRGDTVAYIFEYGGYVHMWSQASAAKSDEDGKNNFTGILVEVVDEWLPVDVCVTNLSRLIRDHSHGHTLAGALFGKVDVIRIAADLNLDFKSDPDGAQIRLSIMGWCAAIERKWILQRLVAGRVAGWRRGLWPFGKRSVPFGYDLVDKQLVPDPTKRAAVRRMMLIFLDETMDRRGRARALDKAGVKTGVPKKKTGVHTPFVDKAGLDVALRSLVCWAPVWCAGEYLFRLEGDYQGLTELSGLPVVRRDDDQGGHGELQMVVKVATPKRNEGVEPGHELAYDGWAEPEVLAAFAKKAMDLAIRAVLNGTQAPRRLDPMTEIASDNPRIHRNTLSVGRINNLSTDGRWRRDHARATGVRLAFTGTRFIEGAYLYETQTGSAGSRDQLQIVRWPLANLPDHIDPISGRLK